MCQNRNKLVGLNPNAEFRWSKSKPGPDERCRCKVNCAHRWTLHSYLYGQCTLRGLDSLLFCVVRISGLGPGSLLHRYWNLPWLCYVTPRRNILKWSILSCDHVVYAGERSRTTAPKHRLWCSPATAHSRNSRKWPEWEKARFLIRRARKTLIFLFAQMQTDMAWYRSLNPHSPAVAVGNTCHQIRQQRTAEKILSARQHEKPSHRCPVRLGPSLKVNYLEQHAPA